MDVKDGLTNIDAVVDDTNEPHPQWQVCRIDNKHGTRWSCCSKAFEDVGRAGGRTFIDPRWTDYELANPIPCDIDMHLYCFEQ